MAIIEVDRLTVSTDGPNGDTIVDGVDFTIERGKVLGIVGESGSGKSTLALALLGYARPGARITGGRVVVDGTDVLSLDASGLREFRRRSVAYVPQDPGTALNPALQLRTQLIEALPLSREDALERVRELLTAVDLPATDAFLKRRPHELSGGQQQRVAIAMAVAVRPTLIVFDEPTTGLDVSTQARVLDLVRRLCADRDISAVYVSHDLAVVDEIADHVAVVYGGEIVESGTGAQVLRHPSHPYTRALLDSIPSARRRLRLVPIPGRAPAIGDVHPGCVFANRCAFATDECRRTHPELVPTAAGSIARCLRLDVVEAEPRAIATERVSSARADRVPAPLLHAESVAAQYSGKQVLFDVSLDAVKGQCLAIVGESGSGKTTLSRCLIGLQREASGTLEFDGSPLDLRVEDRTREQRRAIQYIFQNPFASLNPRATIGASVSASLPMLTGVTRAEAVARARDALDRVSISRNLFDRYPAELSGGQRQRVAIARALACGPELLICDEVTSALDVSVQASIVELLHSLRSDGLSMVFITHNLAVVRSIADRVLVLSGGQVIERGDAESVLTTPAAAYTRQLLADTVEIE